MISRSFNSSTKFYSSTITPVKIIDPAWKLSGRGIFFMGSCFADNLYKEFEAAGLSAMNSPFGNIYNPESIAEAARMLNETKGVSAEECFETGGSYRHFMFHSLKTSTSAEQLARQLNEGLYACNSYIKTAEAVVITLGTSLVYRKTSGSRKVVNNCHKLPGKMFMREQLSVEEASGALKKAVSELRAINPNLRIILSLSPVRHLRDNAAENSLSKAVLRCAIDSVCDEGKSIWYYPSYEIMLDELRDYRWYADDLCHPSDSAVSFIISRFIGSVYDKNFQVFLDSWLPILRDLNHKPFNPESDEYKKFKDMALKKRKEIAGKYPDIRLSL